jgi:hypothetical protein
MKFKGFDDWIEIFRGGKQIDSIGVTHDGDALIDAAIAGFDPKTHEPPLTVGHPADNAPAFGWVEGLKKSVKDGATILLAKFRQVVPEFASAVKEGLYKKRSASFYPDGRLRHVGFLGAAPPAVKALADLAFKDSKGCSTFDFTDPWTWDGIAGMLRRIREYFIEKDGVDEADKIIPQYDIDAVAAEANRKKEPAEAQPGFGEHIPSTLGKGECKMTFKEFFELIKFWKQVEADPDMKLPDPVKQAAPAGDQPKSFTEADLEAAKKEAAETERKKIAAEFAEKAATAAREARKTATKAWYDQTLAAGKIAPAWGDAGLLAFAESLDAETPVEFAEGKKQAALDWFKGFIEGLPKVIEFKEIAGRGKDVKTGGAGEKLTAHVNEKLKANPNLTYGAAFAEVQKEHPDLAAEYAREFRKEE